MAKAVKSHREKKDGAAHAAWIQRKEATLVGDKRVGPWTPQRLWRQDCLKNRAELGTLTEKNRKEIATVFGDSPKGRILASQIR